MSEELREQFEDKEYVYLPIRASSGTILHIGAGIYSSLAGALKELVSNAFDADATRVVISTGYPQVDQIEVIDNGNGMSPHDLAIAMLYIGTSLKRTVHEQLHTELGRPVIGMLGIGLMALTQVCNKAIIESKRVDEKYKFRAELDFSEFKGQVTLQREAAKLDILREPASRTAPAIEQEIRNIISRRAEQVLEGKGWEDKEGELLGYFQMYPNLRADPRDHGTKIILQDLDKVAIGILCDEDRDEESQPGEIRRAGLSWAKYGLRLANRSWHDLCRGLQTGELLYHSLPRYQQSLGELAVMTPVGYFEDGPVTNRPDILSQRKDNLQQYDFSLIVDNTELKKPALLPSGTIAKIPELKAELDYYVEPLSKDREVDKEQLKYEGYIFWQREQVQPSSLRGLQIYVRNVGIGLYDKTILDWSVLNPGPRGPQISGEIYVEEGLERALNIDRNSFRQTDPHFVALQQDVYDVIGGGGKGIVGKSIASYHARRRVREASHTREHRAHLRKLTKDLSAGRLQLRFLDKENDKPYELVGRTLVVYDENHRWPRALQDRNQSQRLLLALETALAAGAGPDEIRRLLQELLLRPER